MSKKSRPQLTRQAARERRLQHIHRVSLAAVTLAVGSLAALFIHSSGAQVIAGGVEAEDGQAISMVDVADANASAGKALRFGAAGPSGACSTSSKTLQDQASSQAFSWPHTKSTKTVVYYLTNALPADWAAYVATGAKEWSNSNCIDARVAASCPSNANCVPMKLDTTTTTTGELGRTNYGFGSDGSVIAKADIILYGKMLDGRPANYQLSTTVHEMGHALGMGHRATRYKVLYSTNEPDRAAAPDAIDFENLLALYGSGSVKANVDLSSQPMHYVSID